MRSKKGEEFRASYFIYSMILVAGIFGVLWGFNAKLMQNYAVAVPDQYNKTFTIITNTSGIDETTQELKEYAFQDDVNRSSSFFGNLADKLDITGLYFKMAYETMSLTPKSIKIFALMSNSVIDSNSNLLGSATSSIRFMVIAGVLVAFIFLLITVAVKWWV